MEGRVYLRGMLCHAGLDEEVPGSGRRQEE